MPSWTAANNWEWRKGNEPIINYQKNQVFFKNGRKKALLGQASGNIGTLVFALIFTPTNNISNRITMKRMGRRKMKQTNRRWVNTVIKLKSFKSTSLLSWEKQRPSHFWFENKTCNIPHKMNNLSTKRWKKCCLSLKDMHQPRQGCIWKSKMIYRLPFIMLLSGNFKLERVAPCLCLSARYCCT